MPPYDLKTFEFRGHRVAYVDEGTGDPIVFLHNAGVSHRLFDHQIEHFRKTRRVIAMDWLGFGASDKPEDISYGARLYIDQLKALKTYLRLDAFDLVACCVGGSIAMLYTDENPEFVETLTVITVATPGTTRGGALGPTLSKVGSWKYNVIQAFGNSAIGRAIVWPHIMKTQLGQKVRRNDPEFVVHCRQNYSDPGVGRAFSSYDYYTHKSLDTHEPSANFPPLLVIWGRDNPVLSAKKGEQLAKQWGATETKFIDRCRYMVMREAAGAVNNAIARHLARNKVSANEHAA